MTGRLLLVVGAIGAVAVWWNGRGPDLASEANQNGFVSIVTPEGARSDTVVIFAPLNCPSDAAQRADALSEELTRSGIRNVRSSSFQVNISDPTSEDKANLERTAAVMNGPIPLVIVRGRAKANPSPADVIAEFRSEQ